MNWLQSILQLIGMGGGGGTTGPFAADAPTYGMTGEQGQSVAIPAGGGSSVGGILGGTTGTGTSTSPILAALGKTDLSKFSHPQAATPAGQQIPLTQLPEFPQPMGQPSLQNLLAAIQARRQRLAGLGIGQ